MSILLFLVWSFIYSRTVHWEPTFLRLLMEMCRCRRCEGAADRTPSQAAVLSHTRPHGDSDMPRSAVGAGLTTAFVWAIPVEAQFISYLSNEPVGSFKPLYIVFKMFSTLSLIYRNSGEPEVQKCLQGPGGLQNRNVSSGSRVSLSSTPLSVVDTGKSLAHTSSLKFSTAFDLFIFSWRLNGLPG